MPVEVGLRTYSLFPGVRTILVGWCMPVWNNDFATRPLEVGGLGTLSLVEQVQKKTSTTSGSVTRSAPSLRFKGSGSRERDRAVLKLSLVCPPPNNECT